MIWRKCRIQVLNRFISMQLEFRANNAALLLSNFQVHRHIKAIRVVTYSYARRPAPVHTRYTNRVNSEDNKGVRNVPQPAVITGSSSSSSMECELYSADTAACLPHTVHSAYSRGSKPCCIAACKVSRQANIPSLSTQHSVTTSIH